MPLIFLDEFQTIGDIGRKICLLHVNRPDFTKEKIAKELTIDISTVYEFFNSSVWEKINQELAKQQIRELVQLAVKTLRDCMLKGKGNVPLQAATAVLTNAKLLNEGKTSIRDNKIMVVWNDDGIKRIDGNKNSVYTALETAGNTRVKS